MTDADLLLNALLSHAAGQTSEALIGGFDLAAVARDFLASVGTDARGRRIEAIGPDLLAHATYVFGNEDAALVWFSRHVPALGTTPESLTGTDEGRRAVTTALGQIEHGVYA